MNKLLSKILTNISQCTNCIRRNYKILSFLFGVFAVFSFNKFYLQIVNVLNYGIDYISNNYKILFTFIICIIPVLSFIYALYFGREKLRPTIIIICQWIISILAGLAIFITIVAFAVDYYPSFKIVKIEVAENAPVIFVSIRNLSKVNLKNVEINLLLIKKDVIPEELLHINEGEALWTRPDQLIDIGSQETERIPISIEDLKYNYSTRLNLAIFVSVEIPYFPIRYYEISDHWTFEPHTKEWFHNPKNSDQRMIFLDISYDLYKRGLFKKFLDAPEPINYMLVRKILNRRWKEDHCKRTGENCN